MSAQLGLKGVLHYITLIVGAISNVALTSNVVTVTTSVAHGLVIGETVTIAAVTNTAINGTFTVAAIPSPTTFTYALTHANITSGADTGSVTPVYTAITNVTDLTLTMDKAEADATTRAGVGWKITLDALKDASVEWEMIWDTTDYAMNMLQAAFMGNTPVQMAVMDGAYATVGSQGLVAPMTVVKFERKEPLTEAMKVSVGVKPAYGTAPAWHTS